MKDQAPSTMYYNRKHYINQPIEEISLLLPAVSTLLWVREVWVSIPGPVKSDTVLPTACHRCDDSSELCCLRAKPR